MTEREFFERLEYRLCDEFRTMRDPHVPGLWCDGLIEEAWELNTSPCVVTGIAWVGGLPGKSPAAYQEEWSFRLAIRRRLCKREDIPWGELLPADDEHGWVTIYAAKKEIRLQLPASNERG